MLLNDFELVSIIVCEYNTDISFLNESISSAINQTYKNIEIIIVDDGSKIPVVDRLLLKDERIKIIRNDSNLGVAISRNIGIKSAHGVYIAFLDSDDICEINRIEEQVKYLKKNSNIVCAGSYVNFFGEKNHIKKIKIKNNEKYRCDLFFGNSPTLINPSVIIRKDFLDQNHFKYDERLRTGEDYDMWVKLSDKGNIGVIKKVLFNYRIRHGQLSDVYRTNGLNSYTWLIREKQLNKLNIEITNEIKNLLSTDFKSKEIKCYDYLSFLKRIIDANNISRYYNVRYFKSRCNLQWKRKIYSASFSEIKELFKSVRFSEKIKIIIFEFERLFYQPKKLFKKY